MRFTIVSILATLIILSCSDDNLIDSDKKFYLKNGADTINFFKDFELPACNEDDIVRHYAYSLEYDENHEQAKWVSYMTSSSRSRKTSVQRTDNFREDPLISTGSAHQYDFSGSGYTRGHLAPAGDFRWNYTAMSESFYMSNMSPQRYKFNAGDWLDLENKVRSWAIKYDTLYVIAAGVLADKNLSKIHKKNVISVCKRFYKVIYSKHNNKAIGFLFDHNDTDKYFMSFAVPVDEVEKATGLDFFSGLPDATEGVIESVVDKDFWY